MRSDLGTGQAAHAVGSPGHERWQFTRRVSLHIRTDPAGLGPWPPLLLEGVSEAKPEDEDHEGDGADGEERVPRQSHPAQGLHVTLAEELAAARIPVAALDRGHRL